MRTIEEIQAELNEAVNAGKTALSGAIMYRLLKAITDGITLDRLQEICQAERDGRLVVLPCKVGDNAIIVFNESGELFITDGWVVENILITENEIIYNFYAPLTYEYERRNSDDFGKTVFLTKEEAEKALKGGAE